MITVIAVALLTPLAAALVAVPGARRLALGAEPAVAAVVLTALALTIALSTGLLLCAVGTVGFAEVPSLAGFGHWSAARLRHNVGLPSWAGLIAGAVALALLASAVGRLVAMVRAARRIGAEAARMQPTAGDLVVVDAPAAEAFAVSGRNRRIVVTTTLLQQLDAVGRRALISHETAHLRHHHDRYVHLARLAAAANPLARPLARGVELAVERWADECAVRDTGSRAGVARAIGIAALHTTAVARMALGAAGSPSDVLDRVHVLLSAAERRRPRVVAAALLVAGAAIWLATWFALHRLHGAMEFSELSQR